MFSAAFGVAAAFACVPETEAGDFASSVVSYVPAPGQFVNASGFGDASAALGAPTGGGTVTPNNSGVVSLGGFGGSLTLAFSETVEDDPLNPMGLDAVVYGNAFWSGNDGGRRLAEAGVIEISRDENGNGLPDDAWYLIPGSDLSVGVAGLGRVTQVWDDDAGTVVPPADVSWYPSVSVLPGVGSSYETAGFLLSSAFDGLVLDNGASAEPGVVERYFGYADLSPTLLLGDTDADNIVEDGSADAGVFYTVPDSPFRVGVDAGSGGGDAFDIGWAVDPVTGEAARLDGFDFVRIRTGSDAVSPVFGEKSVEVDAVADVRPDPSWFDVNGDGVVNVDDMYDFGDVASGGDGSADLNGDTVVDAGDYELLEAAVRKDEAERRSAGRR